MAAAGKRHGYNSQLKYDSDGAGAGAVTLSELCKFKAPKVTRAKVDGTNLESTDTHKEYLPAAGWFDTDEATFDVWFTDTQLGTLITLADAGTEKYFYHMLPLASGQATRPQLKYKGYIASYEVQEVDKDSDEPIRCTFTIQRTSGKITYTAGA